MKDCRSRSERKSRGSRQGGEEGGGDGGEAAAGESPPRRLRRWWWGAVIALAVGANAGSRALPLPLLRV